MKNLFAAAIVTALMLFTASQASAVPVFQMKVQALGGSATTYNGTLDPGNMSGSVNTGLAPINFTGSPGSNFTAGFLGVPGFVAGFELNDGQIKLAVGFQTGTTLPNGVNHNVAAAGSYTVSLSLQNIMVAPGEHWNWANAFSGAHSAGSIVTSISVYIDGNNQLFGTDTLLFTNSFTSNVANEGFNFNDQILNSLLPTSPFSMTAVVTVSYPGASLNANNAFSESITGTSVPEPASLALLASGLLGVGMALRRRKARTKATVSA